jgi:hypothetical protein
VLFLVLVFNFASVMLGLGQFYRPERFNPPSIGQADEAELERSGLTYKTDDGRRVVRPCGLSDTPGSAATSGMWVAVLGLAWALRPGSLWKRPIYLGMAAMGLAVIYFSQVRVSLLLALGGMAVMIGAMYLIGDKRRATIALGLAAGLFMAALAWATRSGGDAVLRRFRMLTQDNFGTVYYQNRGHFLESLWRDAVFLFPLGAGPGRWGMMYASFGSKQFRIGQPGGPLWAEMSLTGFVYDGGMPLLVSYMGGVIVALWSAWTVARGSPSKEVAYCGFIVLSLSAMAAALTAGAHPFASTMGIQFWLVGGALWGCQQLAIRERREMRRAAMMGQAGVPGPVRR